MTFGETLEWQRCNAPAINRLAKLGDKLAIKLVEAYRYLYDHRLDPEAQTNWMAICDDFCRRDLLNTERPGLESKFGHKLTRKEMQ